MSTIYRDCRRCNLIRRRLLHEARAIPPKFFRARPNALGFPSRLQRRECQQLTLRVHAFVSVFCSDSRRQRTRSGFDLSNSLARNDYESAGWPSVTLAQFEDASSIESSSNCLSVRRFRRPVTARGKCRSRFAHEVLPRPPFKTTTSHAS